MNKLNKILLVIIVFLVIALGISVFFCIKYYNLLLNSNEHLYFTTKAVNDKGFDIKMNEDGSCFLVEKNN